MFTNQLKSNAAMLFDRNKNRQEHHLFFALLQINISFKQAKKKGFCLIKTHKISRRTPKKKTVGPETTIYPKSCVFWFSSEFRERRLRICRARMSVFDFGVAIIVISLVSP